MDIEFDTAKDAINQARHGVSLEIGRLVLGNAVASIVDDRFAYGEMRSIAFRPVNGRLFVCVYTIRGATYRIISVRKANKKEQARWLS